MRCVVDAYISGHVADVVTYYREVSLAGIYALDATNALDGANVQSIATYGIQRVGGVDDDIAIAQGFHYLLYGATVGVIGIYLDELHCFALCGVWY